MQWATLDFNNELKIVVGSAGPQPRSAGAEWAIPDFNRGALERTERSGQRRALAARRCSRNMSEKNIRRYVRRNLRKSENMSEKNIRRNIKK